MENKNERITSPEKLEGYLRVIRPSMWVAFAAVFAVVVAIGIWACLDEMTIKIRQTGYVSEKVASFLVSESQAEMIHEGQEIEIGGKRATITKIMKLKDDSVSDEQAEELAESSDYSDYSVQAGVDQKDGFYPVEIVVDGVKPISFLFG